MLKGSVTSARPLSPEQLAALEAHFSEKLDDQVSLRVRVDNTMLGGLVVDIGDMRYNNTITGRLSQIGEQMLMEDSLSTNESSKPAFNMQFVAEDMRDKKPRLVLSDDLELMKSQMQSKLGVELLDRMTHVDAAIRVQSIGHVTSCADGIAWVSGLPACRMSELLFFTDDVFGIVLSLLEDTVGVALLGEIHTVREGDLVQGTGRVIDVPVDGLAGRILSPLGEPLDGKGTLHSARMRPVECEAPTILERSSVNRSMQTGLCAIDAMIPIGKGQRELIIGDRQSGKTAIAIDTILNQKGNNVRCFYVAIGQKISTVKGVVEILQKHEAMEYTTVICASASQSSAMQYIAPYAGCAMAEQVMRDGGDALIIYDDLSKHAVAYRALSLLLRRAPGREAYPGDVFYLHARLLERAAQLSPEAGGGSLTALPIVETQNSDISAYIPTNVISITDGQIVLDTDYFYAGIRPAVNVGLSVSRVGGMAQKKSMRQVSGQLRLELAQYRELKVFAQFGSDLDATTRDLLAYGERLTETFKQEQYSPLPPEEQATLLYAISRRLLQNPTVEMEEVKNDFLAYMRSHYAHVLATLKQEEAFNERLEAVVQTAVQAYLAQRQGSKAGE